MSLDSVKLPEDFGAVQETALMTLWARSREQRRRRPSFRDRKAVELVERIEFDFDCYRRGRGTQLGVRLRTLHFDEEARTFLADTEDASVVEIGVGLNSRFERLNCPACNWVELDFEETIALRRKLFDACDNRHLIGSSILDESWVDEIAAHCRSGPILFLFEGMLMYLDAIEVAQVLSRIADHFPGATICFDALGRRALKHQKRHDLASCLKAPFKWGIDSMSEFEKMNPNLSVAESNDVLQILKKHKAAIELYRYLPGRAFVTILPWFRAVYYYVRLETNVDSGADA